jgi:hypothetical protein
MRADKLRRTLTLAAGVALFAWFVFLVRGGLASWFDADDLMNIHIYWVKPWSALLKANLMFWSSYYRPAGGLFYLSIYDLWGFHPLPFRIVVLALLSVDFVLLAVVVWQLTGSRWGAIVALLLVGINPSFSAAYFDTGTVYDVLAYAFFWGGFALYVRFRQAAHPLGWGRLALVFCLFVAALDAKEIAVSLPVAVGLYELVWHPPASWKLAELWRWIRQEGRFAAIGGLADIAYIVGKRYGPDSLWLVGPYQPHYSVAAYFQSLSHYLCQLIYKPVTISSWQIGGLLVAMLAVAAITRRRCLLWGVGFIAVGVLPVAFIPGRGGFAYLVPSVGWAVYLSGLLDWLLESIAGRRVRLRSAVQVLLLAVLAVILPPWQRTWIEMHAHAAHDGQALLRRYIGQIHALIPAPRKGAQILLLSDAEGRDDWNVYFVIRLHYGDPKLQVYRMTVWKKYHVQVDPNSYDYVLDWVNNRFVLAGDKSVGQTSRPGSPLGRVLQDPLTVRPGLYDDSDPAIVYQGTWTHDKGWPQAHSTTVTFSNLPGSLVRFAFQGRSLAYVYTKAANRGRADIAIDGVRKATLDLYSPKPEWQSRTIFKMGAGRHLAVITILPDKNPKSSDRFIDVDAFEVQ